MKKNIDVARAWRDEEYYLSLSDEERASLGAHPSGMVELGQADLRAVAGGVGTRTDTCSAICTPCPPKFCN
jgi:mersacidin/lichenicidin family type 2 lantibiotic